MYRTVMCLVLVCSIGAVHTGYVYGAYGMDGEREWRHRIGGFSLCIFGFGNGLRLGRSYESTEVESS